MLVMHVVQASSVLSICFSGQTAVYVPGGSLRAVHQPQLHTASLTHCTLSHAAHTAPEEALV